MPTNLQQHIQEWLDSIGADGLMTSSGQHYVINDIDLRVACTFHGASKLVPAYRHAEGTYHTEPGLIKPCDKCDISDCTSDDSDNCEQFQKWHTQWLSHKGEAK